MNFPFYIARRYLFSKKSHHAINIISMISVCGVALATIALVCTLSVFNGFHDLVSTLFTSFDPELKIVPVKGKYAAADSPSLTRISKDPRVAVYTECLEDNALLMYKGNQALVTLKGVTDNFEQQTDIDSILYGKGHFELQADVLNYAILGIQLSNILGTGTQFESPIDVYAPKRDSGGEIDMLDPATSFNQDQLYSPGVVFSVGQNKYDAHYVLTSLSFARRMFDAQGMISSVELRLKDPSQTASAKADFQKILGKDFKVKDRYEQQEDVFRIMKVEKLIAYLFLTFILLVACFNIIGSLSMLIIDKKEDVNTLRSLGATNKQISRIFLFEGRMISTFGAVLGIALGLLLCRLQQQYGFISMGNSDGNFIVDSYPVSVHADDIVIIFLTVVAVGYLSVWYPVRYLTRRLLG